MNDERRRFGPPTDEASADANVLPVSEPFDWPVEPGATEQSEALLDWSDETPAGAPVDDDEGPKVGFLAALIGAKRRERLAARLRRLDRAIAAAPDAPVNYVLRGELRLKLRDRDQAAADFQRALALTDEAFRASDWGLVAQALADRALVGLRRAGYHLRPVER